MVTEFSKTPQKKKNPRKKIVSFSDSTKKIEYPNLFNNLDSILLLMDIRRGDSSRTRSLHHLAPGCRFYPSDEELLNHYLTGKNSSNTADRADLNFYDLIGELNLYDYEPSDLPVGACFVHGDRGRKKHWFCYTESKVGSMRRRAKGGFWSKKGKPRDVFGGGNVLLGTRTKFVFYEVNSVKTAARTSWVMYEYSLLHHLKVKKPTIYFVLISLFC